ncbi:hypothetical protein JR316_0012089 [Psilocybe cubensis]|uniref:Uncharacterized protein n=2 Tax=Psilocybe cubensis TaxID=181762 RepID=A0A8H7XQE7_PSICU|nr:hypothetical protein JR316_0012089 [Psilocybe cubensis]KAH9474990.1 hypothetical protein JR316_0012089 [Psilocybe cubensis]
MSTLSLSGMILGADTEDVDLIFRNINPSKLHTSRESIAEFHSKSTLPTCGVCIRSPDDCTRDPKGSYRCKRCVIRKEECSWKGEIAVLELIRMFPRLTPTIARDAYNRWHDSSRRKRQRPIEDEYSPEPSKKRKRTRAPYRTWTHGVLIPASPSESPAPSTDPEKIKITSLEDLKAFNYSTLKKEKERAEDAREQMAKSLEAALHKIDALELEIERLKTQAMLQPDHALGPVILTP